jgi:hypothetical protein
MGESYGEGEFSSSTYIPPGRGKGRRGKGEKFYAGRGEEKERGIF